MTHQWYTAHAHPHLTCYGTCAILPLVIILQAIVFAVFVERSGPFHWWRFICSEHNESLKIFGSIAGYLYSVATHARQKAIHYYIIILLIPYITLVLWTGVLTCRVAFSANPSFQSAACILIRSSRGPGAVCMLALTPLAGRVVGIRPGDVKWAHWGL